MTAQANILLQTTIPYTEDDWHVGRFSLLAGHLRGLTDGHGRPLYNVQVRNRETDSAGNDQLLSTLDRSAFDELWLFGVESRNGLSSEDCTGITRFRKRGGGIFSTRGHADLGSSLCTLGGVGAAHYFHSTNPDPDASRRRRDDCGTASINYPNYHSGANGDYQLIDIGAPHDLLRRKDRSFLKFFPANPHEGGVGAPPSDPSAQVIATGTSLSTGRLFNLVVAFERSTDRHGNQLGRAIAQSSFHHVVDYNWDTDAGCPSFVEEAPRDGYKRDPNALDDIKQYVANVARWLAL